MFITIFRKVHEIQLSLNITADIPFLSGKFDDNGNKKLAYGGQRPEGMEEDHTGS